MKVKNPVSIISILLLSAVLLSGSGCSLFILGSTLDPSEYLPKAVLIIVSEEVYPEIADRITTYQDDISADGIASRTIIWNSGDSAVDLKFLIQSAVPSADTGFFIGDIPAAWYEQKAFGSEEVFPTDLFYMDTDSIWSDSDDNGRYDSHSNLSVDFVVSRATGTAEELNFYFDKLHGYRSGTTPAYDGAFIFKDDDWHNSYRGNNFGLDTIYGSVSTFQDSGDTTRSSYLSMMLNEGSEYVYQWIHAYPPVLFIDVDGNYEIIRSQDIGDGTFKGNFYNLFDCQAARFTVRNLAASYLNTTDSGIAVIGSTKTGGMYYPVEFHKALASGGCWGSAYKAWYNTNGWADDEWFLGMIIMGDPAIRPYNAAGSDLSKGSRSVSNIIPLSDERKDEMYLQLRDFKPSTELPVDLQSEIEQRLNDY
ncbi:MAG: hypothetical protein JEZ04_17980 [Spirochaetales bacterium]|nr:hypothetical protein [Spirochaetales bacterium]